MSRIGVLLAAGTGSRFEEGNKLCQYLNSEPVVRHAARSLVTSPVDKTVVILGHDAERVRNVLQPLRGELTFVYNERYGEGQSTSVRRGAKEVLSRGGSVGLFALGDMPQVAEDTYERILETASQCGNSIVVPEYRGRRGNPVLFDVDVLHRFTALSGDVGGRALFEDFPVNWVTVDDPGIHTDIDTVSDLKRYC